MRRLPRLLTALLALLGAPLAASAAQADPPITIFAAASLHDALGAIAEDWSRQGNTPPRLVFGASGALARQIEQGAPALVFISADEKWMTYLQDRHLILDGTRGDLLTNRLVLVAPATAPAAALDARLALQPGASLLPLLGPAGRLAIGGPTVPAGIYAQQALAHLGMLDAVKSRLTPAEDVRAALHLVESGDAALGIVYASDTINDPKVRVLGVFPDSSHDPITYPAAAIAASRAQTARARAFLSFLHTPEAALVFRAHGFGVE